MTDAGCADEEAEGCGLGEAAGEVSVAENTFVQISHQLNSEIARSEKKCHWVGAEDLSVIVTSLLFKPLPAMNYL
jgi:hypothetical protein